jgi:hypothetical protein
MLEKTFIDTVKQLGNVLRQPVGNAKDLEQKI